MTTLGSALEAFIREHEYCGELDTGLENDRVWMTCTCGGDHSGCRSRLIDAAGCSCAALCWCASRRSARLPGSRPPPRCPYG
jgi:hypothetical protein